MSVVTAEMAACVVTVADPSGDDVRALVATHREWSHRQTPPEFSFAVSPGEVAEAGITLYAARGADGTLLGVAGLKELDDRHGEIKTMHVAADARGSGVGRALLVALLEEAARRGYERVSLETGTGEPFAAARALYESAGFRPGPPFGGYENTAHNLCMTLEVSRS